MGGPLKLKFANHFIIYKKRPFRGRIVPGRLHSELCAWGVKKDAVLAGIAQSAAEKSFKLKEPNLKKM